MTFKSLQPFKQILVSSPGSSFMMSASGIARATDLAFWCDFANERETWSGVDAFVPFALGLFTLKKDPISQTFPPSIV